MRYSCWSNILELRLIGVRLGEHNFRTERDCEKANELEVVCAERYQDFSIEKTHFHPEFSRGKLQNDIALVRLNNDADFRPQNVRPICMPIGSAAILSQKKVNTIIKYGRVLELFNYFHHRINWFSCLGNSNRLGYNWTWIT